MKKLYVFWDLAQGQAIDYDVHVALLAARLGDDYEVTRASLLGNSYFFDGTDMSVITDNGDDLAQADAVYFARWRKYQNALATAVFCDRNKIPYKTREVRRFPATDKLGEHALLSAAGIVLPRTVIASAETLTQKADTYALFCGERNEKMVLKGVDASFGNDNFIVADAAEIVERLHGYDKSRMFILQRFIPNSSDYRVLVFNGRATVALQRSRLPGDDHRNNTAQGGQAMVVPLEADIAALAERAASALSRSDIAGVDIVRDDTNGMLYVLEVNKMPVIGTNSVREEKMGALIEFIRSI